MQFLSTPSARRATNSPYDCTGQEFTFLSTPSARRATVHALTVVVQRCDFYPHPPRGGRPWGRRSEPYPRYFYPRPPRGGRRGRDVLAQGHGGISIHALREEGDARPGCIWAARHCISIHALREEGDYTRSASTAGVRAFLSTPSARRATQAADRFVIALVISIHALREEGDTEQQHKASTRKKFLSTPSARRATQWRTVALATGEISIHALREEGDRIRARIVEVQVISIHALREEGDPAEQKCSCGVKRFLSTPSARRATSAARGVGQPDTVFLSTPSARRATSRAANSFAQAEIFLSTPSARRATKIQAQINTTVEFLSTPSARRATFLGASFFLAYFISIHALREEGDP